MEKDFNKEDSNSDDIPEKNKEDEELSIIDKEMILIAQQRSLQDQLAKIAAEMNETQRLITYMEQYIKLNTISESPTSPVDFLVSPEKPPIKSHTPSNDSLKNLDGSNTSARNLKRQDSVSCKTIEKKSEEISVDLKFFQELMRTNIKILFPSASKASDTITQAPGSCTESETRYNTPPESSKHYIGKGKEAAQESFRYKKRSKSASHCDSPGKEAANPTEKSKKEVSTSESLAKDSADKSSEESISIPESKALDAQSSKVEPSRISSGMKRRLSYEKNTDYDDHSQITKKIKLEGEKEVIREYPTLSELLSKKDYESIDLAQFMDLPETDQPSISGLSNVADCTSNSEESSLASEYENVPLSARGDSSLTTASSVSTGETGESSLASECENVPLSEREESSLTTVSNVSTGDRGESSLASGSEDTPSSGYGDSKHFQS